MNKDNKKRDSIIRIVIAIGINIVTYIISVLFGYIESPFNGGFIPWEAGQHDIATYRRLFWSVLLVINVPITAIASIVAAFLIIPKKNKGRYLEFFSYIFLILSALLCAILLGQQFPSGPPGPLF
ncbi:hypothetical protein ACFLUS_04750 [Chloroflexota bacterium]